MRFGGQVSPCPKSSSILQFAWVFEGKIYTKNLKIPQSKNFWLRPSNVVYHIPGTQQGG